MSELQALDLAQNRPIHGIGGGGGRGAAVGLGQLVPSAKKQATEKWLTQLQHGAGVGRGTEQWE